MGGTGDANQSGNDWFAIGAYALVAVANQLLWLTFAPITTESAQVLGVSEDAIGLLSEIFPLIYVLLAIPAGMLLDRWLDSMLIVAATFTAVGGVLRFLADGYELIFVGQLLVAVAQPFVLGAVTKLSAERVAPDQRTLAISIGSAGIFAGALAALVLGATVGAREELATLLAINAVTAIVALAVALVALRNTARFAADVSAAVGFAELRAIYADPTLRRLGLIAFLGFGVFVATTTWLQVLLEPSGVTSGTAGWILVGMTGAGVLGAILLPEPVATRRAEFRFLRVAAVIGAGSFALLAAFQGAAVAYVVLAVVGLLLLGSLPVILELTEQRAGDKAGASATAAIWLAGNLGGVVLALVVQAITDRPTAAFATLAAAMLLIVPFVRGLSAEAD